MSAGARWAAALALVALGTGCYDFSEAHACELNPQICELTVTGVDPGVGSAGSEITLTGTGLDSSVSIFFDRVEGTVVSAEVTRLVVRAPKHAPGIVRVVVDGWDRQTAFLWEYAGPPWGPTLTPDHAARSGGATFRLEYGGHGELRRLTLGGCEVPVPAGTTSPAELTVPVCDGPPGLAEVTIETSFGKSSFPEAWRWE